MTRIASGTENGDPGAAAADGPAADRSRNREMINEMINNGALAAKLPANHPNIFW
jgi:hypothetical protein